MFASFIEMARQIANFIVTLVEMASALFTTLLKKAVTGASPVAAADKNGMGMIEYLQPYGWDPYGPGLSEDPYQQQRPETATCHYLQQTWQRQCAARPETVGLVEPAGSSFLQLGEGGALSAQSPTISHDLAQSPGALSAQRAEAAAPAHAAPAHAATAARPGARRLLSGRSDAQPVEGADAAADGGKGESDAQTLYESSMAALPASLKGWLEALPSISPEQQHAWAAGAGRPQAPSTASAASSASSASAPLSAAAAAAAAAATAASAASSASAAAAPDGVSGFKLMGTMNAGMFGLGASYYNGPDLYDPQGPNGPEPVPQTGGPEKCYRLLNSWIYKCAVSPM